jgi:Zn-dependent protease with chaperone function
LIVTLSAATLLIRSVSLDPPSAGSLLAACSSFALPSLTAASVALLAVASGSFAVILLGVRAAHRQLAGRRRFLRSVAVVGQLSAPDAPALVIDEPSPQAFCTGFMRPRVYVSTGALELLGRHELDAVLAHEAHHARRRDPLRLFVARTLAEALFFVPVLQRLADRYEALAELAADEAAIASTNDRSSLAEALLAFDRSPSPAVVGIAPERVDHLMGQQPRWELPVAVLATTLIVLVASAAALLRVAEATSHMSVNIPLLAAQACMLLMALVPPAIGAIALVNSRRIIGRRGG